MLIWIRQNEILWLEVGRSTRRPCLCNRTRCLFGGLGFRGCFFVEKVVEWFGRVVAPVGRSVGTVVGTVVGLVVGLVVVRVVGLVVETVVGLVVVRVVERVVALRVENSVEAGLVLGTVARLSVAKLLVEKSLVDY